MNDAFRRSRGLRAEVFRLGELCLDDAEDGNDRRQLELLLTATEQARDYYLEFMSDSSLLRLISLASLAPLPTDELASSPEALANFQPPLIVDLNAPTPSRNLASLDGTKADGVHQADPSSQSHLAVGSKTRPALLVLSLFKTKFIPQSLLPYVALTALCFYGSFMLIAWNLRPEVAPQGFQHQDRLAAENPSNTNPIAKIVGSANSSLLLSSAAGTPRTGPAIIEGDTLEVTSGTVELAYDSGARVLLQAPTRFRVDSLHSNYLHQGTLVARIPALAHGFMVQTPSATVIDLGTEFSIVARDSGDTEVNVLRGRVSVQPTDETATPRSAAFVLETGEGKRIHVDGAVEVATDADSGIWKLLADSATQRVERQTFPPGLVSYWAFDEVEAAIRDHCGISHGETSVENRTTGLIGRAALRSQRRAGQMAEIYSCEPAGTFSQGLSIEAMLTSSWSGKSGDYDYICRKAQGSNVLVSFAFQNDGQDDVDGPVLALEIETDRGRRSLYLPLDERAGHPKLASLTDGKPHYVAATFNGQVGELAIYVDGVQQIRRSIGPSNLRESDEGLPARSATSAKHFDDPFAGIVDEIAVYRVPLSANEIARHWKNVSQGRNYFAQE